MVRSSARIASDRILRGLIGELNDRLLAYHLAEQRNQPAEETRIEGEVRDAWKQLRDWLGDGDVDHELKDLLDLIQH